jgi:hypothetical protein
MPPLRSRTSSLPMPCAIFISPGIAVNPSTTIRTTQKTSVTSVSYVAVSTEDGAFPMPPSANAEYASNTFERRIVVVIEITFVIFLNAFFVKNLLICELSHLIFF